MVDYGSNSPENLTKSIDTSDLIPVQTSDVAGNSGELSDKDCSKSDAGHSDLESPPDIDSMLLVQSTELFVTV